MENAEFSDEVVNQLFAEADQFGIASIPVRFRRLIVLYDARGLISNGGFEYFFERGRNMGELVEALSFYEFYSEAEICHGIGRAFPHGKLPDNTDEINAFLAEMTPQLREVWESRESDWLRGVVWERLDQRTNEDLKAAQAWLSIQRGLRTS